VIYFDNAATTFPKPQIVINNMYNSITKFGGNPGRSGHRMSLKSAEIIYSMREKAAKFFGISGAERVILTKNCTESLNIAIFGVLKNGGNAIISHFEHNSVIRPLQYLKNEKIADYKIANVSFTSPEMTVAAFKKLIDNQTKMIICTHASNVTGKIAPIKQLAKLCHENGLIFCVDASQTAGLIDINMENDDIDILCCPGHKALYGPLGTGLFIVRENIDISPFMFGGTGSLSASYEMPDFLPDMFESGTLNVPGAAGLDAGIDFINKIGIKKLYKHEMNLIRKLYNSLNDMSSVLLYTTVPEPFRDVPTLSFNVKGYTCTHISEHLNSKNIALRSGFHCSPLAHSFLGTKNTGTVRVSLSYFNTMREIEHFCNVLNSIK